MSANTIVGLLKIKSEILKTFYGFKDSTRFLFHMYFQRKLLDLMPNRNTIKKSFYYKYDQFQYSKLYENYSSL